MTRFGVTAAALAAGALLWSSYAKADPITVNAQANGGATVCIPASSNGGAPMCGGSSPIAFAGITESGFTLTGSSVGTPPDLPGRFSSNSINVGALTAGEKIMIWFTEQNLSDPSGKPLQVISGLTANLLFDASATLSTYLDSTNTVAPPTGTPLATHDFMANGAESFTTFLPPQAGLYSLQELYVITALKTDESTNLTIDIVATAVPEPGSLALLGTGLLGLAMLLFWKAKKPELTLPS